MFFLTIDQQKNFDAANVYLFDGELDTTLEEDFYEDLEQYLDVLPQKFGAGISERTLFKNHPVMAQFKDWCNMTIEQFTLKCDEIYEKRETIVDQFNTNARIIFSKSFHGGQIIDAEKHGNNFCLLLDMSNGFTVESIVMLVFHDVQIEGELEGFYLYDELIKTENGFGLRVLSSFDRPYVEWTILFKDITANYLYRPAVSNAPLEICNWDDYVAALNRDYKYYIIKNMTFVEIDLYSILQTSKGFFVGNEFLGNTFEETRERIYCDTYVDPYAYLSEPIVIDELKYAIFDEDQTVQVRAFNTIFELEEKVADIVNYALRKTDVSEDNMYFEIMASHFNKLGVLEDDVKKKWIK